MNRNLHRRALPVFLAAVSLVFVGCQGAGNTALVPLDLPELQSNSQALVQTAQGIVLGNEDAPVTIVEFADFQCPGCGAFAGMVKPQIELAWVETGQVKFVFYDFPLTSIHPHAFLAARAARCANEQNLFWDFHDALFRYQSRWSLTASPPIDLFEDYAAEVGLEQGAFSSCLRSDRHAETVTANMILGEQLGVTGTPSVMVSSGGGMARQIPANSFEAIQDVVTGLLAEVGGDEASEGSQP